MSYHAGLRVHSWPLRVKIHQKILGGVCLEKKINKLVFST